MLLVTALAGALCAAYGLHAQKKARALGLAVLSPARRPL